MIIAVCCLNPLVSTGAHTHALLTAFSVFVPAGPSDAELPASDADLSEESDAEDSESDSSELTLSSRDDHDHG